MTLTQTQEQHLLQRLISGEQPAFRSIYDGFYRYLVVTAYAYLRDNDLARDTAQEVFVDLWRRRQELPEINSLKAYLRRGVCNKSLDILRHRKRWQTEDAFPETISDNSRTEQLAETSELTEAVQNAIAELPEKCRTVFLLSRYEQLSHKEIAEKLDISTKTIENQMTKALRHMRTRLEEQGFMLWLLFILEKYRG
jgi:RNA polymerase sigma-70 factor, ECF subfamily